MEKTKIFISSTMNDMIEERMAIVDAIGKNRSLEAIYAEEFNACNESPRAVCLEEVKNSHMYIGIFKNRYGYIPEKNNKQGLSVVHLEYCEAKKYNLPIFIFVNKKDENREEKLKEFL
jgi:hypothetical protein